MVEEKSAPHGFLSDYRMLLDLDRKAMSTRIGNYAKIQAKLPFELSLANISFIRQLFELCGASAYLGRAPARPGSAKFHQIHKLAGGNRVRLVGQ
jgi:hypothetical protein